MYRGSNERIEGSCRVESCAFVSPEELTPKFRNVSTKKERRIKESTVGRKSKKHSKKV